MTRKREENPRTEGPLPGICASLILQSPVSTWIADPDGTNIFENEAARRLLGIERDEEVVGKYNIFKDDVLIAGGFMPQIRKVFEEGGSTEIVVDYDFSQVKHVEPSHPTHRILHAFLFAIKDREGRVRNVIVQHEDWTERTSTEEALRKSEERYRDLAEGISDWIWEIDLEGRCTYSNPAIESILGYTPEEVIGKPIMEFIPPEDRARLGRQMGQAAAEGSGIVGALTGGIHKDGSIRYIETNAKPMLDESGNLVGYRGMNRDVTDRVEAERALQENEERFRALIENAPDIITVMNADGIITYVSPSIERVLGYDPEEPIGRSAFDRVHPDDVAKRAEDMSSLLRQEGVVLTAEFRLRHRDGSWRTFEFVAQNLLGNPAIRGLVINQRDITERRHAEAELERYREHLEEIVEERTAELKSANRRLRNEVASREQAQEAVGEAEARLSHLVSSSPAVIYTSKAYGDYAATFVSENVEWQLGYQPREFTDDPGFWAAHIHPDDLGRVLEELTAGLAAAHYVHEYRFRRKDGSYRWMRDEVRLIHDADGNPTEVIGSWIDITPRREAEDELQRHKEHLEELVRERTTELTQAYERLHTIVDTSPLAVVTLDLDGKVTSWNPAAENMFGWAAQEVIGKPMPNLPDDQLPVFREFTQRLLRGEVVSGLEAPHVRKDGARVEISVSIAALHDSTGAIVGFMGVLADITERKRAEEALRESEEKYRALISNIPDVAWTTSADGDTTFVAPNVAQVYGYTPEEIYEAGPDLWFGRIHPDDVETVSTAFRRLFEAGIQLDVEYRVRRKDGEWIWLQDRSIGTYEKDGKLYADGVFSDITKRRQTEEALRESEAQYRQLIEMMNEGLARSDKDYVLTYVNDTFADMLGYRPEEMIGRFMPDFVHEDARSVFEDQMARRKRGEAESFELAWKSKDGSAVYTIVSPRPMFDQAGNFAGSIAAMTDITERKQAEEELEASEERFRALTENSSDIVMVVNAEGNIMYISPAVERILGYRPEEMIGTPIFDLGPPEDAARARTTFRALAEHEGMIESGREFRLRHRDGSWHIMEVTAKNMLNDPAVGGIIINHRDITERVEAERRTMELEEHRTEFYRKTIEAATEGKLVITEADEIEKIAGRPIAQWEIKSGQDLSSVRQAIADEARVQGMDEDRVCDFILAVGELTTNAYKHAGGGKTSLHRPNDSLMVDVSDHGKGMEALSLPEVALVRGYSTAGTLGMGYKAVLSISDIAFLATGPTGTTVAIQMSLHKSEVPVEFAGLPDTWKS